MEKKKRILSREFVIGAIGMAALLLVYFLINFFKGIDLFKMGERYFVRFENISQLANSSPVYINGFKAGNVQGIHYDYADMKSVIVEMEIDKKLRIPQGSTAKISTHMLGGTDMSIVLSDSREFISPGDTINGMLDLGIAGEASEKIMPAFDRIVPKLDSILTSLNTLIADPSIKSSVSNVEEITRDLAITTKQMNRILGNDVPQITERLVRLEDDLLAVSSQLGDVDYKHLFITLDSALVNIQQITDALNSGQGTAGMLMKDSTLYNNLNNTCKAATALLENLRENPKRYVHFSLFGKKAEKP